MELKLYNLTALEEATGGDKDFMANMIQLIIVETPKDLKAIEIALENKEYPIVSSIVHKIKPSINYFCISKLLDDMIAIEAWENKDEMMVKETHLFIANIYSVLAQLNSL
jgi:hypothetical protein